MCVCGGGEFSSHTCSSGLRVSGVNSLSSCGLRSNKLLLVPTDVTEQRGEAADLHWRLLFLEDVISHVRLKTQTPSSVSSAVSLMINSGSASVKTT